MNEDRYEEVKHIANRINELVDRELNARSKECAFQEAYEHLKSCIARRVAEARSVVKMCKQDELTLNALESEGFLRCAIETVKDLEDAEDILRSLGD